MSNSFKDFRESFDDMSSTERENVQLFDVYVSYSNCDGEAVDCIKKVLKQMDVSAYYCGSRHKFASAPSGAKIFVPVVSKNSREDIVLAEELLFARSRGKTIWPILLSDEMSDIGDEVLSKILMQYQIRKAPTLEDVEKAAYEIAEFFGKSNKENTLFDKYSEYKKAGLNNKAAEVLFEIIKLHCDKLKNETVVDSDAKLLLSYTEELAKICRFEDSDEGVNLAMNASGTMGSIVGVVKENRLMGNLLQVSVAMRIMSIVREIDRVTLDIITGGMVSNDRFDMSAPLNEYKKIQERYAEKYYDLKSGPVVVYKLEDVEFIEKSKNYYFGNISVIRGEEKKEKRVEKKSENLYEAVANFMNEGNRVLDIIGAQKPAKEFIKCLITSYERLKAYSEVVGAKEILGECIEKIAELKQKLLKASEEVQSDEIAQNGIKSLLGLAIPKSGEYDVFISHKREDFDLALDMYEFLKANLKEGFFDKYSLPEMSNSEYRQAIMQALDGSKHFVVVFSNLEYLKSEWVSLEMRIFQSEMDEGRKNGNFLMVATDDVYDEIMKSKKSVLPIEYRRCEIIRLEDYKNVLIKYLN